MVKAEVSRVAGSFDMKLTSGEVQVSVQKEY